MDLLSLIPWGILASIDRLHRTTSDETCSRCGTYCGNDSEEVPLRLWIGEDASDMLIYCERCAMGPSAEFDDGAEWVERNELLYRLAAGGDLLLCARKGLLSGVEICLKISACRGAGASIIEILTMEKSVNGRLVCCRPPIRPSRSVKPWTGINWCAIYEERTWTDD